MILRLWKLGVVGIQIDIFVDVVIDAGIERPIQMWLIIVKKILPAVLMAIDQVHQPLLRITSINPQRSILDLLLSLLLLLFPLFNQPINLLFQEIDGPVRLQSVGHKFMDVCELQIDGVAQIVHRLFEIMQFHFMIDFLFNHSQVSKDLLFHYFHLVLQFLYISLLDFIHDYSKLFIDLLQFPIPTFSALMIHHLEFRLCFILYLLYRYLVLFYLSLPFQLHTVQSFHSFLYIIFDLLPDFSLQFLVHSD